MKIEEIKSEKDFLDSLYKDYEVKESSQTRVMRELFFKTISPFLSSGEGLEIGCSDGYMTEMIASRMKALDVIDGSNNFITEARKRNLPNVFFLYSLFEEYAPEKKYDFVFASYVREHVLDPVLVLKMVKNVLKPDGLLFVLVPNSRALSRQLALHMGLYKSLDELTENDIKHGHRRVYNRNSLDRDIEKAGFNTIIQGGLMFKILADFQLDRLIDEKILQKEQLDGLYKLGLEYPDFAGSLFSVCKMRNG